MTGGADGGSPAGSITDVDGIRVGQAQRVGDGWLTGVTVVLPPADGAVAGVDVRGGGPGTRETDLLDPRNLVERVHAIVLTGGSALGLAAADGVARALLADGIGFSVGMPPQPGHVVPIVPGCCRLRPRPGRRASATRPTPRSAPRRTPPRRRGWPRAMRARGPAPRPAGSRAASAPRRPGCPTARRVGALVVVNAVGSPVDPRTGELWAARLLRDRRPAGAAPARPGRPRGVRRDQRPPRLPRHPARRPAWWCSPPT